MEYRYPLDVFYERDGRTLPEAERLRPADMPQPYRRLLVHRHDMTPTLAEFYREPLRLEVLNRIYEDDLYAREVVLFTTETEKPVEYGAIRIFLEHFPEDAAREVVEAKTPLGYILGRLAHFHESPQFFLRIQPNETLRKVFGLITNQELYARRNTITNDLGGIMAEVIEILPPVEDES